MCSVYTLYLAGDSMFSSNLTSLSSKIIFIERKHVRHYADDVIIYLDNTMSY